MSRMTSSPEGPDTWSPAPTTNHPEFTPALKRLNPISVVADSLVQGIRSADELSVCLSTEGH